MDTPGDAGRRMTVMLGVVTAAEAAAFYALAVGGAHVFSVVHVFASLLAALAVPPATPRMAARLGATVLVFATPPLGALALAVGHFGGLYFERRAASREPRLVVPHARTEDDAERELVATATEAIVRLVGPSTNRVKALMSLRHVDTRLVVPILRHALGDPDDEVRLLAYAMLDRRDEVIQRRIQEAFERLSRATPVEQAVLHRVIAENHWELVHSGLAAGELATHVLDAAAHHAAQSAALEPRVSTFLLESRIEMRRGRVVAANRALDAALRAGAAPTSVLPLLAEVAFRARRFDIVRHCLQSLDAATAERPKLGAVRRFWLEGVQA